MDVFTQAEIVNIASQYRTINYTYAAAVTLVVYDSLILFRREVNHIYSGPRSLAKWIYVLIKVMGLTMFSHDFYTYYTPHKESTEPNRYDGFPTTISRITGVGLFEVGDTAIIKTLLVMRLRALYRNHRGVTIILCITTAIELMSTTYAYVMAGLNNQWYVVVPDPLPGCTLGPQNTMTHFRSPVVAWSTRLASNSLELLFLLYGLYRCLKGSESYFKKGWGHMRQIAPVLYVFYRDGTMFYIPIFVLSAIGFVGSIDTRIVTHLSCANWEAWLAIAYYICGTRLILNIYSAGTEFTTSMITQHVSSVAFNHGSGTESDESDDGYTNLPKTALDMSQRHETSSVTV
ncbi:hypothetical protein P691DRAFT_772802 [Macrolepiota fuliginosa MF-IS2]|uniref:DUF6533 domain-containing protein n=1 Tax=Macrolepiota fuliginosa MF-IS2 TaxID=1400762 RepID=A0A9P5XI63_9AGAR|nr:hypothetical protein P691DRAFT_772802 [Macrolepiota fuliginosa MF-IS2]